MPNINNEAFDFIEGLLEKAQETLDDPKSLWGDYSLDLGIISAASGTITYVKGNSRARSLRRKLCKMQRALMKRWKPLLYKAYEAYEEQEAKNDETHIPTPKQRSSHRPRPRPSRIQ